jgi:hypothetical protein
MEPKTRISEYLKTSFAQSNISIFDCSDDGLLLHHYKNKHIRNIEKCIRGVITTFDGTIVMPSLPLTEDFYITEQNIFPPFLFDGSKNTYFKGLEGTIIRLYNYNGTWKLSTNKKINASQSRWGGIVDFETLFKSALLCAGTNYDEFLTNLSVDKQYIFLLNNVSQTRIVSPVTNTGPTLYLLCVYNGDEITFVTNPESNQPICGVNALEKITEYPADILSYGLEYHGLFVVSELEGKLKLYKIITPQYKEAVALRGTSFCLESRYLELRNKGDEFCRFLNVFGDCMNLFFEIEVKLNLFCSYLLERYNTRFFYGKYAYVEKQFYGFFLGLQQYQTANQQLTIEDVNRYIMDSDPKVLEQLIFC